MSRLLAQASAIVSRYIVSSDVMAKIAIDLMHLTDHLVTAARELHTIEGELPPGAVQALAFVAKHVGAIEETLRIIVEEHAPKGTNNG